MSIVKTSWKFFEVKSLSGIHIGIHAVKNIMGAKGLSIDEFCEAVGIDSNQSYTDKIKTISVLEKVKDATNSIECDPEDTWVCLAVCNDINFPNSSYRPAVLICRD
jgi:hypothetical protein